MGEGVEADPTQSFFHFLIAYILSGQLPDGPLYAAAQDAARPLTPEVGNATVAAAEQWIAGFRAATGAE
jgi:hypothetical protein